MNSEEEATVPPNSNTIEALANREYKYGFVTDIEADDGARAD